MSLFDKKNRILVSASQITNFNGCNRYWWFNKIKKEKIPFSYALVYGTKFHKCIETSYEFIKEGLKVNEVIDKLKEEKFDPEIVELVEQGWEKEILELPEQSLIEKRFKLRIEDFGIMRGAIDFYNVNESRIEDHKTVGNWKYALTQDDLKENIQLMIYAYYIFSKLPKKKKLKIRHNQFFKNAPNTSKFVEDTVDRSETTEYWNENVVKSVKNMVECSKETEEKNVSCNKKHCGAYGGCPFEDFCNK